MIWTFEVYNYAFWSHECVIWVLVYGKCPFPSLNIFMIVCWMTSCSLKTLVQQVFHVSNPFESQSLVDGCRGSISLRITIDLLLSKGFMPFSNWWIESLRWHISFSLWWSYVISFHKFENICLNNSASLINSLLANIHKVTIINYQQYDWANTYHHNNSLHSLQIIDYTSIRYTLFFANTFLHPLWTMLEHSKVSINSIVEDCPVQLQGI